MKIRSNGKVFRSESEWNAITLDYRRSGLTLLDYCQQHGIAKSSLFKALNRKAEHHTPEESFIEIAQGHQSTNKAQESEFRVELCLGESIVLRIR